MNAALYGYAYREQFEEDAAEDDETTGYAAAYALSVSDVVVFAATAAIAGIIGNAAYDAIKAVVRRILSPEEVSSSDTGPDPDLFIRYVSEYHVYRVGHMSREIANRVVTEMFIDEQVHIRHSPEGAAMTSKEIEIEARRRVTAELRISTDVKSTS